MDNGRWTIPASIAISLTLIALALVYRMGNGATSPTPITFSADFAGIERMLTDAGVIDASRFTGNMRTELNLLWAFGLANQNRILTEGPMMNPRYGGAGNFASTGGWTLARGNAMDHYAAHRFVALTEDQQQSVEWVAKDIYRPCCGNSTYFPDCNHGMAMLGLLELKAAEGATEDEMYAAALETNKKWFPDTYDAIGRYFEARGVSRNDIDPQVALGYDFSSAAGYERVLAEVAPAPSQGGGSCGV